MARFPHLFLKGPDDTRDQDRTQQVAAVGTYLSFESGPGLDLATTVCAPLSTRQRLLADPTTQSDK
jgi:hypothetical protein